MSLKIQAPVNAKFPNEKKFLGKKMAVELTSVTVEVIQLLYYCCGKLYFLVRAVGLETSKTEFKSCYLMSLSQIVPLV